MKLGNEVRVKQQCKQQEYRGRTGTVVADNAPGETVDVEFDDEAITHSFNEDDLELI